MNKKEIIFCLIFIATLLFGVAVGISSSSSPVVVPDGEIWDDAEWSFEKFDGATVEKWVRPNGWVMVITKPNV